MEGIDKIKETDIKFRRFCSFDDAVGVIDINFSDILLNQKSYKNILTYDVSYKNFMGAELLRIWFEKVDEFIKIYDGIRDLELFALERYNGVYDKINHLTSKNGGIKY